MTKYSEDQIIKARLKYLKEYYKLKEGNSKFGTVKELCEFFDISKKTLYKWRNRYEKSEEDPRSLLNRSTAPKTSPRKPPKWLERTVVAIRDRLGWSSLHVSVYLKRKEVVNPNTGKAVSEYGVRCIWERYRRGAKYEKEETEEVERYEKDKPGELAHIDIKKLPNVQGEDPSKKKYQHALNDDCTRIPYVEVLPDKRAKTAADFFERGVDWFDRNYDIQFEALLSDNGKEYTYHTKSGREKHTFEKRCKKLGIKHKRTRVARPQTNGKVERFFRTLDDELHHKYHFESHKDREMALKDYLRKFRKYRMHFGMDGLTPEEKLEKVRSAEIEQKDGDVESKKQEPLLMC
ncbi:IS481 family transposase [Candidatus Bipolaricaulota bacterium]|nr:IS481 family transposase [Candidatus Bipolaricaulota bacterium]